MPSPEPIPGAPPYVVWTLGLIFIVLAIAIVVSLVAIAMWIYGDARERGAPALLWLVIAIIGGWLAAIAWMLVRERYGDPADIIMKSAGVSETERR